MRPRPPSPWHKPVTPPPTTRLPKTSISDKPTDPRRQPPPPRPRNRSGEVIDVSGVKPPAPAGKSRKIKERGTEPVSVAMV